MIENEISKKREFLNVIQLNRKIFQIYAGFEISCHPKSGINLEHDFISLAGGIAKGDLKSFTYPYSGEI